ncbi:MAG: transcription termination/antitermination protein NusA [Chloroflexi bacterium]|nr:transcription termination/antitermination protein NusA [Chloroflexota bacterium]
MKSEFYTAIATISAERGIPKEAVISSVEQALRTAYKRVAGGVEENIVVRIDPGTGEARVFIKKTAVEQVTDPAIEIALADARRVEPETALGDDVLLEDTPRDFGRIAAQTAKQVILQRIREYERENVYEEFKDRVGEVVTGLIQRADSKAVIIELGKAEAVMPAREQVPTERYRPGQRVKVYLAEVVKDQRGPQLLVSRTHPGLLRRLFELEVPEIYNGVVEIKAIAREPGLRSKVAVHALQDGVDPVGSCVGMRGVRIQNIVSELYGEKIDVVEWSPDTATFISKALSPAKPLQVVLDQAEHTALVVVPRDQVSLAIGKEGQNARLAYKLTGWRIDVKDPDTAILPEDDAMRAARALLMGADTGGGREPRLVRADGYITYRGDRQLGPMPFELQGNTVDVETLSDRINIYDGDTLVAAFSTTGQPLGVK